MTFKGTVAAVGVLLTAGCAATPPDDPVIDTLGTNADVGSVHLRNVRVEYPEDHAYRDGDDARVFLTLVNSADHTDRLVRVTTPHAEDVTLFWDKECDGTAERVAAITLTAGGTVPSSTAVREVGHLPYHLEITGFDELLFAGTTVPLTFTFAEAGMTTIDAMVQTRPHDEVDGLRACSRPPTTPVEPDPSGQTGHGLRTLLPTG